MLKKIIKRYVFGCLATTYFQPLFKGLHSLALWGMNIGLGSDVDNSGERYVLRRFAKTISLDYSSVVFDIGANRGEWALTALEVLGQRSKIYCFEPQVAAFKLLSGRLQGHPKVSVYNFGLGEYEGCATLYMDKEGSGCASLYNRKGLVMAKAEQVKILTLDGFCADKGINRIDYLKLDVEGHELAVLRGGVVC